MGCWRGYLAGARHTAWLMPLPHTVSCFSKIQIGFTFLVPAHPGSPGQRAVKWVRKTDKLVHYAPIFTFWYSRKRLYHYTECINTPASGGGALPPRPPVGALPPAPLLGAQLPDPLRPPPHLARIFWMCHCSAVSVLVRLKNCVSVRPASR